MNKGNRNELARETLYLCILSLFLSEDDPNTEVYIKCEQRRHMVVNLHVTSIRMKLRHTRLSGRKVSPNKNLPTEV